MIRIQPEEMKPLALKSTSLQPSASVRPSILICGSGRDPCRRRRDRGPCRGHGRGRRPPFRGPCRAPCPARRDHGRGHDSCPIDRRNKLSEKIVSEGEFQQGSMITSFCVAN